MNEFLQWVFQIGDWGRVFRVLYKLRFLVVVLVAIFSLQTLVNALQDDGVSTLCPAFQDVGRHAERPMTTTKIVGSCVIQFGGNGSHSSP